MVTLLGVFEGRVINSMCFVKWGNLATRPGPSDIYQNHCVCRQVSSEVDIRLQVCTWSGNFTWGLWRSCYKSYVFFQRGNLATRPGSSDMYQNHCVFIHLFSEVVIRLQLCTESCNFTWCLWRSCYKSYVFFRRGNLATRPILNLHQKCIKTIMFLNICFQKWSFGCKFVQKVVTLRRVLEGRVTECMCFSAAGRRATEGNLDRVIEYSTIWKSEP